MAGRIVDEDIQTVRERARIDEIVGAYVQLQRAGGGSLKGLCPFHSEKTPSFQVTPSRGFYYCFGCGAHGDVISFVQNIDNLSFAEAVQHLADRVGIQLRFEDDDGHRPQPGTRLRVMAANAEAARFFAAALMHADEAAPGRELLDGRGFGKEIAEKFGCGWAPKAGRELTRHLQGQGFSETELITAGLTRSGGWDFFQGRLLWPIRDAGQQVLGFGARRVLDDDRMPAKYINTPETPVYKKSSVLYGLDLARSNIGKKEQVVVVEGYTDVMACHVSGVDTAVASCGTAFGADHAHMVHRLLGGSTSAEVIFTFDGDSAGQKAALKVYDLDRSFTAQTYVAIEPSGMDPCDLRLAQGEAAVRELVGRRTPLYRFVMRNILDKHDLDRADGRLSALREAAPLVRSERDSSLQMGFARELAGMLGMPEQQVLAEMRRAPERGSVTIQSEQPSPDEPQALLAEFAQPSPDDRLLEVERAVTKLMVQAPMCFTPEWNEIRARDFSHPGYRAVFAAVEQAGEPLNEGDWPQQVLDHADGDALEQLIVALTVESPLRAPSPGYVAEYAAKLRLLRVNFDIRELKSKLQRTNPIEKEKEYWALFSQLLELETRAKQLTVLSWGGIS